MAQRPKVCMISCNHSLLDDRIYWKEARSLQLNGYDVSHLGVGAEPLDYTTNEGIHIIQLKNMDASFFSHITLSRNSIYLKILQTAASLQAEVYHLHDWQLNIISKKLKQLSQKPKVIYDSHDATSLLLSQNNRASSLTKRAISKIYISLIKAWEKNCLKNYDAVITAEPGTASLLKSKRNDIPFLQVYNFSYFEPFPDSEENPSKIYDVIYAGLIENTRGIEGLVKASQLVKQTIPQFKLLIIGGYSDKNYLSKIEKLIATFGLENNVIIKPPVPFQQIHQYYRISKIGICVWHLTKKNLLAIPIKIFEYMAFGLPTVFSFKGIATSFIEDSKSGLLVNPYSPIEISHAIIQLLQDERLYKELSKNGKIAVTEKYNWKQEEQKLLSLYNQIATL